MGKIDSVAVLKISTGMTPARWFMLLTLVSEVKKAILAGEISPISPLAFALHDVIGFLNLSELAPDSAVDEDLKFPACPFCGWRPVERNGNIAHHILSLTPRKHKTGGGFEKKYVDRIVTQHHHQANPTCPISLHTFELDDWMKLNQHAK